MGDLQGWCSGSTSDFQSDSASSNLVPCSKINADMAELADAVDLKSTGKPYGFKSHYPYHGEMAELG